MEEGRAWRHSISHGQRTAEAGANKDKSSLDAFDLEMVGSTQRGSRTDYGKLERALSRAVQCSRAQQVGVTVRTTRKHPS